jgi:hypothetical protein
MTTEAQMSRIPSHESCRTALDDLDRANSRTPAACNADIDPMLRADMNLETARVYLGRIAAYRAMGEQAPEGYVNFVRAQFEAATAMLDLV